MIWLLSMGRLGRLPRWRSETVVLVFGMLTLSASVRAQGTSADELGRRHFESGAAYLEESDYENALQAFQKAYELSKRPEILLNVATVEERRGNVTGALRALREYLVLAPSGAHVDTVKLRIQNLEKREPKPAADPPAASAPPPVAPPAAPPVLLTPAPAPSLSPASAPTAKAKRVPAFIALGAGAIAAGGAVLTGVLAKSEYDDAESSCGHRCSDSQLSTGRTLAVTSTILTGAALIGAGIGITLLVLEPAGDSAAANGRFELGLQTRADGGSAQAAWRF